MRHFIQLSISIYNVLKLISVSSKTKYNILTFTINVHIIIITHSFNFVVNNLYNGLSIATENFPNIYNNYTKDNF